MQNLLYRAEIFDVEPKVEIFNSIEGKADIGYLQMSWNSNRFATDPL